MHRRYFDLEQDWYIAKDENDTGKAEGWERGIPSFAVRAKIPSVIQEFFPEYHGLAYYFCRFTPLLDRGEGERVLLRFGGVDYRADVYLNGTHLGTKECPEAPFSFDVTSLLTEGENLLAVRVLNPTDRVIDGIHLQNVPHRNKTAKKSAGSNLNHGGIWYGVSLEVRPRVYLEDVFLLPSAPSGELTVRVTLSEPPKNENASLTVSVRDSSRSDAEVAKEVCSLPCDATEAEVKVTVPTPRLWSLESPSLYPVEVLLSTPEGEDRITHKTGFRTFELKDGYFYLNGKRLFLKSAHTGNAFPVGQMHPVYPDQMRRDMIYAKSAGFQMLRAIAGMLRPEQIALADEIGLLIFEECFASWCLGNSERYEWNDETYAEVSMTDPSLPLGDEKALLRRWRESTERMILRDRNHPSVVIWGLLNETKESGVFREAVRFLPRARELDPSRLILLNSGRWDYDMRIGSASNPHSPVWEHTWGYDGDAAAVEGAKAKGERLDLYMGDNHYYATVPLTPSDVAFYRTAGQASRPYFQSEMGIGPLFNVIDEYRHFEQNGERLDLEDATFLEYQATRFAKDFHRLGLDRIFAFPERLLRESQKNSALDRRLIFDAIRSNPHMAGYSLTGLLDHGMCGEGLWTYWRHWKPGVFDAVSDGWEPLRFCLFVSHCVYGDTPIEVEAVLANDGVLPSGTYSARFAILGERGIHHAQAVSFSLNGDDLATPVWKESLNLSLPEGTYTLVAELESGAARGTELSFRVFDRKNNMWNASLSTLGLGEEAKKRLAAESIHLPAWQGEKTPLLLVGKAEAEEVSRALSLAKEGASVVFLDREIWDREDTLAQARRLIPDLEVVSTLDWLYHKELVLNDDRLFRGVGRGIAPLRDFAGVFSKHTFTTKITPDFPLCPAFLTGYYGVEGAYALSYAFFGVRHGEGRVYFSTLELLSSLGTPVADRILANLTSTLLPSKCK